MCRYVRDWKSIEAHIGTKTAIQVCRLPTTAQDMKPVDAHLLPWSAAVNALSSHHMVSHSLSFKHLCVHCSQIRSHAQKYFQKQVKSGNADAVPPPRPKRQV